jgi:hypothetical protein
MRTSNSYTIKLYRNKNDNIQERSTSTWENTLYGYQKGSSQNGLHTAQVLGISICYILKTMFYNYFFML